MKFIVSVCFLVPSVGLFGQQSEFSWLMGTWKEKDENAFEVWTKEGDWLSGSAYKIDPSGNKTFTEEIKLVKKGNDFYYVPDVAGPQGPVEFRITAFDKNSFTAENPLHDFPKKIVYKKISDQQLEATISHADTSISYYFKKVK